MRRNDELYHYGTKGQEWGKRLYQNPDGTYTMLGKLRRRKELTEKQREKVKKVKEAKKMEALKKKKNLRAHDLSKFSTEELEQRTKRLNAEKNYLEARANVAKLNPRIKSKGEKFADIMRNEVAPALRKTLIESGQAWLKLALLNALGVSNNGKKDSSKKDTSKDGSSKDEEKKD